MRLLPNWIRKRKEGLCELGKWIITLIEIIIIAAIFIGLFSLIKSIAKAEDEGERVWVLCHPDSYVTLRVKPGKNKDSFGGVTCGGTMLTDGKANKGYLHVYDLAAEEDSGWISIHYIVYDEPIEVNEPMRIKSDGRVACRKSVDGKIIKWLYDGDILTVFWASDEWSITNLGYVKSYYLEQIEEGEELW